jgi:translation elongation factor EF-Tu-like GTPase
MNEPARIEAEVAFLPESEGGRRQPPTHLSGGVYRPHLVVGDPKQRRAITIGNEIRETYLGVAFLSGPAQVEPGEPFLAELVLLYWPHRTYEALSVGATFTIREGAQIVGYGQVKRLLIGAVTS